MSLYTKEEYYCMQIDDLKRAHPQIKVDDQLFEWLMENQEDAMDLEGVPGPTEGSITVQCMTRCGIWKIAIWDPLRDRLIYAKNGERFPHLCDLCPDAYEP